MTTETKNNGMTNPILKMIPKKIDAEVEKLRKRLKKNGR